MPLGLDTPSTFGVGLPDPRAGLPGRDRSRAPPTTAARARLVPGDHDAAGVGDLQAGLRPGQRLDAAGRPAAGLLGSLTAIALVIISFLPLLDIAAPAGRRAVRPGRHPGHADGALGVLPVGRAAGDINAFFGLMLDNVGDMILMASLLVGVFGFPARVRADPDDPGHGRRRAGRRPDLHRDGLPPGAADRRADVTAMPLGLDTPSTFGIGLPDPRARRSGRRPGAGLDPIGGGAARLVPRDRDDPGLGPVQARPAPPFSGWIRRVVPRAGLLGSLAAIALVIISFLPLLDIAASRWPGSRPWR